MAKIEYIIFGGQDEREKSCSALVIDGDIFVINCGIAVPSDVVLGIQKILPDFTWLIENKNKVKGIFVPVATYSNYGGLEFLTKHLPNVPVYTSFLGKFIISNYFKHRTANDAEDRNEVNFNNKLEFEVLAPLVGKKIGNTTVYAFRTASFLPNSFGLIFNTSSGGIIFLDEFIISTNKNVAFYDMIFEINMITKYNNLLLLVSVGRNIGKLTFASPHYSVNDFYDNILTDVNDRTIVAVNDEDVYKVISLANIASKKSLPFVIFSNTLSKVFDFMVQSKIISLPNLLTVSDSKINEMKKGIIVITGTTQRLIAKIQKIIDGEDPKVQFVDTDTFIYSNHTINGYEKMEANMFDEINRLNVHKTIKIPNSILSMSQCNEDHKFMLNLLKPKYVIPLAGLYMDFVTYQALSKYANVEPKNILLIENGQMLTFENEKLVSKNKKIKLEEQYVGTQGVLDVAANSLFERDQMAENGCVLVSLLIDKRAKKITHSNFNLVGVVNVNDEKNKPIIDEINGFLIDYINNLLTHMKENENISKENQNTFKKQIIKQYEKKFGKRPLILLTILYNDSKQLKKG